MSCFSKVTQGWVIRKKKYSAGIKIWIKGINPALDLDSDMQPGFYSFSHWCQQMLSVQVYQSLLRTELMLLFH